MLSRSWTDQKDKSPISRMQVSIAGSVLAVLSIFTALNPIELMLGVSVSFASVFLLIGVLIFPPWASVFFAFLAVLATQIFGIAPPHFILLLVEALFILKLLQNSKSWSNIIFLDSLFWTIFGLPIVYIEQRFFLSDPHFSSLLVAAIVALSGIFNLVVAHIVVLLFQPFFKLMRFVRVEATEWRISNLVNILIIAVVLFPVTTIIRYSAKYDNTAAENQLTKSIEYGADELVVEVAHLLEFLTESYLRNEKQISDLILGDIDYFLYHGFAKSLVISHEDVIAGRVSKDDLPTQISNEISQKINGPIGSFLDGEIYFSKHDSMIYTYARQEETSLIYVCVWDAAKILQATVELEPHLVSLIDMDYDWLEESSKEGFVKKVESQNSNHGGKHAASSFNSISQWSTSKVFVFSEFPELDSVIGLSASRENIVAPLSKKYAIMLIYTLISLNFGLILVYILSRKLDNFLESNRVLAEKISSGLAGNHEFRKDFMVVEFRWLSIWFEMLNFSLNQKSVENDQIAADIETLMSAQVQQNRLTQDLLQLIESSGAPIIEVDVEGTIIQWNQMSENLFGYSKEEVFNEKLRLENLVHESSKHEFAKLFGKTLAGEKTENCELTFFSKSGEQIELILSAAARRDAGGEIIGAVCVGHEVTELKRAQAKLQQASKLATLGEMATGVAHELNQPLSIIQLASANILSRLPGDSPQCQYVEKKINRIEEQVTRATKIIDHMRLFGREATEAPTLFDPHKSLLDAVGLIGEQIRLKSIDLKIDVDAIKDAKIRGHFIQFEQVILNLLSNARDAIDYSEAKVRVISVTGRIVGENVELEFDDTGGGIPDDVVGRIFDPFFTTKGFGEGTGLGLSVSYGIVKSMKGTITAANTKKGARFSLQFPIAHQEEALIEPTR